MSVAASASAGPPTVFASPSFVRLWLVGGIANAVLWLEVLAASLFILQQTGSGLAVALVSAARAAPLIVAGALAGIVADASNRKHIVVGGLLVSATAAGCVAVLAALGRAGPVTIGVAALASGFVYSTEMPARRRLVAEAAGPAQVDTAIAADSLTSFATRCLGPLLGGLAFATVGLAGAFLLSCCCSVAALAIVAGLPHRQEVRPLRLAGAAEDLREALRFARRRPLILALLAITVTMNLCGYSYAAVMAPVAKVMVGFNAVKTGILAAAEPSGAFIGGLLLTRAELPGARILWLGGGVGLLTSALLCASLSGWAGAPFWVVCAILAAGGLGSAVYTNAQISIALAAAPPALRSRVMGLVTVCIGSWPVGMVLAGLLIGWLPPLLALAVLAGLGLVLLGCIGLAALVIRTNVVAR